MDIRLDLEEHELLTEILQERQHELLHEIAKTDRREFKDLLKKKEQVLENLLRRLRVKEVIHS